MRNFGDIPANQPLTSEDVAGLSAPASGLTDTELRAAPVAVDVVDWPAVQSFNLLDFVNGNGARVKAATPLSNDYGLVTRNIPSGSQTVDGTVAVSNFPQTQAVSGTVAVSNLPATQPVSGSVSVSNFPSTQPVSATALPLPAGASTEATLTAIKAKTDNLDVLLSSRTKPGDTQVVEHKPALSCVSSTGAAGAGVTATLPAAGAGLFHYVTMIQIVKYATAAITGAAAPVVVTTTNLPGSLAFTFETAQAIGTRVKDELMPTNALKSSAANVATTIVCPATTSVIWRVNVFFYTG